MSILDDIKENIRERFELAFTNYEKSTKWKEYHVNEFIINHCILCLLLDNKIYDVYQNEEIPELPQHEKCGCYLGWMRMQYAGMATDLGRMGADYYLKLYKRLPNYYITKEEAKKLGWKGIKGNLDKVAPGKMIGGNIFLNREGKLPSSPGRIWYECDINYEGGYRNNYRLLYSNDGIMFKTDCHYTQFISIE